MSSEERPSSARPSAPSPRGRATGENPANRFTTRRVDSEEEPPESVPTLYLDDASGSILSTNDSPDVPFDVSLNPYRGCEHGCVYCYARPTHEYLGYSAGLDFESRILVKRRAPELLRQELSRRSYTPGVIALCGVTDPYQPIERKLELTRRCLAVLAECRNPVAVVTKNALVERDLDLFTELARHRAAAVYLSITTLDAELARRLEPRASHPRERLAAIRALAKAGIPVGVLVAPVIPALTDHEIPAILREAAAAGAKVAHAIVLRLPGAVAELFTSWLAEHYPDRLDKVLNRQRSQKGGKLNDPRFGHRMRGEGVFAEQIKALFAASCRRAGLNAERFELSAASFRCPQGPQLGLFDAEERC